MSEPEHVDWCRDYYCYGCVEITDDDTDGMFDE